MANDPTLDFLTMFDDPSEWIVKPNVPFMIPHEMPEHDGRAGYKVDEKRLSAIVTEMQALETEEGVLPKVQIGHTTKDAEPEILGYVRNRRIDTFGPKKEKGAIGDVWFHKDKFDKARGHPFRSVEWYPPRNSVTAVALLSRDPELDMGMVHYDRGDDVVYYHMQEKSTMPDPVLTPEIVTKMINDAVATALAKKEAPVVAEPIAPVATLTAEETIRLAREEQAVELRKQSDAIVRLEKALAAEQLSRRTVVAENTVKQLQLEGYVVKNTAKLVEKLARLSDEAVKLEVAEIRENYSRAPLEQPLVRVADTVSGKKEMNREDYQRAVSYATANNVSFDEALIKCGVSK